MFRPFLQSQNLTGKTISSLLIIALSGVLCLCCYQIREARAETDSCPLSRTSHCDFSRKDKSAESAFRILIKANVAECCAVRFNVFAAKLEANDLSIKAPTAAGNHFSLPKSAAFERSAPGAEFSYQEPVFDSRELRVKNCVFRI